MSTTTTNLGLIKPERSDNYSVDVISGNMDIIDTKIGTLEGKVSALDTGDFGNVNGGNISMGSMTVDTITPTKINVPINEEGGICLVSISRKDTSASTTTNMVTTSFSTGKNVGIFNITGTYTCKMSLMTRGEVSYTLTIKLLEDDKTVVTASSSTLNELIEKTYECKPGCDYKFQAYATKQQPCTVTCDAYAYI